MSHQVVSLTFPSSLLLLWLVFKSMEAPGPIVLPNISALARRETSHLCPFLPNQFWQQRSGHAFPVDTFHFPPIYVMHAICVCVYVHGVPTQTQKGQKPELPCKLCRIFRHDNSVSKQTHFPQNIPSHTLLPAVMTFSLCRAEIDLWRWHRAHSQKLPVVEGSLLRSSVVSFKDVSCIFYRLLLPSIVLDFNTFRWQSNVVSACM